MARSLGYRPTLAWLKVVAPALYPLIRLPVFAVIAYASSVVDVAMILGPTLPPTLAWPSSAGSTTRICRGASWPRPVRCCSWA
jgi:ABC-type uncharacterized transport system YnjBCD permease subunit